MKTTNRSILAAGVLLLAACGGKEAVGPVRPPAPVAPPTPPPPTVTQGSLSGKVTDSVTNQPLSGVEVIVQVAGTPRELARVLTGADGSYRFTALPYGQALLVSTQPTQGSVVYAHEVGTPVTLVRGAEAGVVNLVCAHALGSAHLEVRWGRVSAKPRVVSLIQSRPVGGGWVRDVLVKRFTVPGGTTTNTFHQLAPGHYRVVLGPIFPLWGAAPHGQAVTLVAGQTAILVPAPVADPAAHHAPEPPKVVHHPYQ